jgi:alpha-D-ribose 1-methylphosphonate 5-triphosphate diphosphatase PhnM
MKIKRKIFADNPDTKVVSVYVDYTDGEGQFWASHLVGYYHYEDTWDDEDIEKFIEENFKIN